MNLSKQINNQKGASAVEFAIVLPLFVLFTFGIIEFGIIMYNKAVITNASREGARFGVLFRAVPPATGDPTITEQIEDKVKERLNMDPDSGAPDSLLINLGSAPFEPIITVLPSPLPVPPSGSGTLLKVTVEYDYDFLIVPSFATLLPQVLRLSGVTTMRIE